MKRHTDRQLEEAYQKQAAEIAQLREDVASKRASRDDKRRVDVAAVRGEHMDVVNKFKAELEATKAACRAAEEEASKAKERAEESLNKWKKEKKNTV